MKRVMFIVGLLIALSAFSEVLIVTKKGKAIRASSAKKVGEEVLYMSMETGQEEKIAVAELDGVIPKVRRGKQYKPEEVVKYVARVKGVQRKHKALYRQLNTILQEWESLQKSTEGLEEDIAKQEANYKSSDKSIRAYKDAVVALGMVSYKDLAGKYKAQVDALLEEMRVDFIKVNLAQAIEVSAQGAVTVPEFDSVRIISEAMLRAAKGDEKAPVSENLENARLKALATQTSYARAKFLKNSSVDSVLYSAGVYYGLIEKVCSTDAQKAKVMKELDTMFGIAKKKNAKYRYDQKGPLMSEDTPIVDYYGYPMSSKDRELIASLSWSASYRKSTDNDYFEECHFLAESAPKNIKYGSSFSVPIRLVFRVAQPADRKLGLMLTLPGEDEYESRVMELSTPTVVDGHMSANCKSDFSDFPSGFRVALGEKGKAYMGICVVYEDGVDRKGNTVWTQISRKGYWRIYP